MRSIGRAQVHYYRSKYHKHPALPVLIVSFWLLQVILALASKSNSPSRYHNRNRISYSPHNLKGISRKNLVHPRPALHAKMAPQNDDDMGMNDKVLVGPDINISRTPLDKKKYRQIIIKENGLRVILVSDTLAMIHQENVEYDSDDSDTDTEVDDDEKKQEKDDYSSTNLIFHYICLNN